MEGKNLKDISNDKKLIYMTDNILSRKWKQRYAKLSKEKQVKLDILSEESSENYQLKVIKRKRPTMKIGDIFIVNPKENLYFYGVILCADVMNMMGSGMISIVIFKNSTKTINTEDFKMDFGNLLVAPTIVDRGYWTKGYFYNLGTSVELPGDLDYGFWRMDYINGNNKIFDEFGNVRSTDIPKIMGVFALKTFSGIAYTINQELIIDETLLL